jgi:hypothetical protein
MMFVWDEYAGWIEMSCPEHNLDWAWSAGTPFCPVCRYVPEGARPATSEPSITCPVCAMTSYNPNDIREGYCGNCHEFTGVKTLDNPGPDGR